MLKSFVTKLIDRCFMSFAFSDVSTSLFNMIQQELPANVVLNSPEAQTGRRVFAEKLDQTIQSTGQSQVATTKKSNESVWEEDVPVNDDQVAAFLFAKLDGKEGHQFLSALKSILIMLSKGNLNDISVDSSGLDVLKKMLIKAGFSEEDINDLIEGFEQELETGTLTLDQVFDSIADLSVMEASAEDQSLFIKPEDASFWQSILISLGMPAEKVDELFRAADAGNEGVDLDTIIDGLQKLQKEVFYTGQNLQVSKNGSPISMLAQSLDVEIDTKQPGSFSLNDIVRALENLRHDKISQQAETDVTQHSASAQNTDQTASDLMNSLFKTLKMTKEQASSTGSAFSFSTEKISEQFAESFVAARGNGSKEKGPLGFNTDKSMKNEGLQDVFKEIQALLEGNTKGTKDSDQSLEGAMQKFQKPGVVKDKSSDLPQQGMAGEVKTGETEIKFEIPRPRTAPKTLPSYVTQQVGKSLVRAINQGENTLKIQLKPPELGRLLMTIDNTGNSMRVSIMTENHAAKEIITQNVTELRSVLSNSGVNLERFEVDMSSDFRQSMADARQQSGNFGKRGKNKSPAGSGNSVTEGGMETANKQNTLNQDGSVHLVA